MFYVLSWLVVAALLAFWSLAAWALHAMAVWTISNAGELYGSASGVGAIALPEWLAPWVPQEMVQLVGALGATVGPVVDGLLQAAPALAGGVTAATWVLWSIGSVVLVLIGVGLHLLIALWRRRSGGGSGPNSGPSLAAG